MSVKKTRVCSVVCFATAQNIGRNDTKTLPTGKEPSTRRRAQSLLEEIFPEERSEAELMSTAQKDASTFWFGTTKGDGKWTFEEGTTYEDLVLNTPKTPSEVFPGLISFVGQTGRLPLQKYFTLQSS